MAGTVSVKDIIDAYNESAMENYDSEIYTPIDRGWNPYQE